MILFIVYLQCAQERAPHRVLRNITPYLCRQAALSAGKHVIVEKPLVPTSSEATKLIDLASANKLVLATYQNRRWDSDFLTVRRLLDVERVFGASFSFHKLFQAPKARLVQAISLNSTRPTIGSARLRKAVGKTKPSGEMV